MEKIIKIFAGIQTFITEIVGKENSTAIFAFSTFIGFFLIITHYFLSPIFKAGREKKQKKQETANQLKVLEMALERENKRQEEMIRKIKGEANTIAFNLSTDAINFLDKFSQKTGQSKSVIVKNLIMELKEKTN